MAQSIVIQIKLTKENTTYKQNEGANMQVTVILTSLWDEFKQFM